MGQSLRLVVLGVGGLGQIEMPRFGQKLLVGNYFLTLKGMISIRPMMWLEIPFNHYIGLITTYGYGQPRTEICSMLDQVN